MKTGWHQFPHQQLQQRFLVGGEAAQPQAPSSQRNPQIVNAPHAAVSSPHRQVHRPPQHHRLEPDSVNATSPVSLHQHGSQGQQRVSVDVHLFSSSIVLRIFMTLDATFLDVVMFLQRRWSAALLDDDGGTVLDVFVSPPGYASEAPDDAGTPPCAEHHRASMLWGGGESFTAGVQMKLSSVLSLSEQKALAGRPQHQQRLWSRQLDDDHTLPLASNTPQGGENQHSKSYPKIVVAVVLGVERREAASRAVAEALAHEQWQHLQRAFTSQQSVRMHLCIHPDDLREWASMAENINDPTTSNPRGFEEDFLMGSCVALLSRCSPSALSLARSQFVQPITAVNAAELEMLHKPMVWHQTVAALSRSEGDQRTSIQVDARIDALLSDVLATMPWWRDLCTYCERFLLSHGIGTIGAAAHPQLSIVRSAADIASGETIDAKAVSLFDRRTLATLRQSLPHYDANVAPKRFTTDRGKHNLLDLMKSLVVPAQQHPDESPTLPKSVTVLVSVKPLLVYWRTRARVFVNASQDPAACEGDTDGSVMDVSGGGLFYDLTSLCRAAPGLAAPPAPATGSLFHPQSMHPSLPRPSLRIDVMWPNEALTALEAAYICFARTTHGAVRQQKEENNTSGGEQWSAASSLRPYEQSRLWWQHKVGVFLDKLGFQVRLGCRGSSVDAQRPQYQQHSQTGGKLAQPIPAAVPPSLGPKYVTAYAELARDGALYDAMVELEAQRISQSTRLHLKQQPATLDGWWEGPHRQHHLLVDAVPRSVTQESVQLAKFLLHVRATGLLEEYRYPGLHDATRVALLFTDVRNRWKALCSD